MALGPRDTTVEKQGHEATATTEQDGSPWMCGISMDDAGRYSEKLVRNTVQFGTLMNAGFGHAIENTSQLFVLFQQNSQAPLSLSAVDLGQIRDRICPSLDILKIFEMFQGYSNDYYVLRTGTHFASGPSSAPRTSFEASFVLKFVERSDQKGLTGLASWSLRQAGFYQKYDLSTKANRMVLIRPSHAMKTSLRSVRRQRSNDWSSSGHWTAMPSLLLEGLGANWCEYITEIYAEVCALSRNTSHTDPYQRRNGEADVYSLSTAAFLLETVQKACHVLSCNIKVLSALRGEAQRRSQTGVRRSDSGTEDSSFDLTLEATARDLSSFQDQLELMERQLDATMSRIRDLVQLRNLYMTERLTIRTVMEARAVRLISVLTLLFIPPSLTMSFIEMNLVHVTSIEHGLLSLSADSLLWFWFAITLALMVVVIIGLLAWQWCSSKARPDEMV